MHCNGERLAAVFRSGVNSFTTYMVGSGRYAGKHYLASRRLSHLARRLRATFKVGEDLPVQKFPSRMGKPRCC